MHESSCRVLCRCSLPCVCGSLLRKSQSVDEDLSASRDTRRGRGPRSWPARAGRRACTCGPRRAGELEAARGARASSSAPPRPGPWRRGAGRSRRSRRRRPRASQLVVAGVAAEVDPGLDALGVGLPPGVVRPRWSVHCVARADVLVEAAVRRAPSGGSTRATDLRRACAAAGWPPDRGSSRSRRARGTSGRPGAARRSALATRIRAHPPQRALRALRPLRVAGPAPWRSRLTWNSSSCPRGVSASIVVVQLLERRARAEQRRAACRRARRACRPGTSRMP